MPSAKDHEANPPRSLDPVVEAYKKDVDRTLLEENLKKTPHERVLALIALQKLAREAREADVLIRAKRAAGRPNDLEVLAELEALRDSKKEEP